MLSLRSNKRSLKCVVSMKSDYRYTLEYSTYRTNSTFSSKLLQGCFQALQQLFKPRFNISKFLYIQIHVNLREQLYIRIRPNFCFHTSFIINYFLKFLGFAMVLEILEECHISFVACFDAFYPTSSLKWNCLCDLLSQMDKVRLQFFTFILIC